MQQQVVIAFLLAGCAPDVGMIQSAVNGTVDDGEEWSGVVGMQIEKPEGVASCTGVLIAPNLLLTARHCVSSTQPRLICGEAPLAAPVAGENILSTNDVTVEATSLAVRALRAEVPPDGDDECGFDIAAVILQAEVPGAVIYPPRVEEPVTVGETFTAVGYGTDGSSGIGTRRAQGDVAVACLGDDCAISVVQPTEWVAADDAFCRSDSGAPAIDSDGMVIGIVSKGINPCQTPVLSSVYAWREWIASVGRMAAEEGGYPVPLWALAPDPDAGVSDAGVSDAGANDASPSDSGASDAGSGTQDAAADAFSSDASVVVPLLPSDGGCSVGAASRERGQPLLLLLCFVALWRRHQRC